jgi:hypothetical protein
MAALVTLAVAKAHLRITDPVDDYDIELKAEQATQSVLDRCNSTAYWRAITPTWTQTTVPLSVQAAILLVLAHLWEHRGDNMQPDAELWEAVTRLIRLHSDPVIA